MEANNLLLRLDDKKYQGESKSSTEKKISSTKNQDLVKQKVLEGNNEEKHQHEQVNKEQDTDVKDEKNEDQPTRRLTRRSNQSIAQPSTSTVTTSAVKTKTEKISKSRKSEKVAIVNGTENAIKHVSSVESSSPSVIALDEANKMNKDLNENSQNSIVNDEIPEDTAKPPAEVLSINAQTKSNRGRRKTVVGSEASVSATIGSAVEISKNENQTSTEPSTSGSTLTRRSSLRIRTNTVAMVAVKTAKNDEARQKVVAKTKRTLQRTSKKEDQEEIDEEKANEDNAQAAETEEESPKKKRKSSLSKTTPIVKDKSAAEDVQPKRRGRKSLGQSNAVATSIQIGSSVSEENSKSTTIDKRSRRKTIALTSNMAQQQSAFSNEKNKHAIIEENEAIAQNENKKSEEAAASVEKEKRSLRRANASLTEKPSRSTTSLAKNRKSQQTESKDTYTYEDSNEENNQTEIDPNESVASKSSKVSRRGRGQEAKKEEEKTNVEKKANESIRSRKSQQIDEQPATSSSNKYKRKSKKSNEDAITVNAQLSETSDIEESKVQEPKTKRQRDKVTKEKENTTNEQMNSSTTTPKVFFHTRRGGNSTTPSAKVNQASAGTSSQRSTSKEALNKSINSPEKTFTPTNKKFKLHKAKSSSSENLNDSSSNEENSNDEISLAVVKKRKQQEHSKQTNQQQQNVANENISEANTPITSTISKNISPLLKDAVASIGKKAISVKLTPIDKKNQRSASKESPVRLKFLF
jgi:hypothetical protein